jgi:hypothetical protein
MATLTSCATKNKIISLGKTRRRLLDVAPEFPIAITAFRGSLQLLDDASEFCDSEVLASFVKIFSLFVSVLQSMSSAEVFHELLDPFTTGPKYLNREMVFKIDGSKDLRRGKFLDVPGCSRGDEGAKIGSSVRGRHLLDDLRNDQKVHLRL